MRDGSLFTGLTAGRGAESRATVREITDNGLPERSVPFSGRSRANVGRDVNGVAYLEVRSRSTPGVPNGNVYSFAEDGAGNVWVSHQEGLFRLFHGRVVERIPWARLGRREPARCAPA